MKILAQMVNFFYWVRLPLTPFSVFALEKFLWKNPHTIKSFLVAINPKVLWASGEVKLLALTKEYIPKTPALEEIASKHFPGQELDSIEKFKKFFPILDKKNYIAAHSLAELSFKGILPRAGSFYTSAGTTGKPSVWVESVEEELFFDKAVAFLADIMLNVRHKEYIVLNCWALGSWPTGINFFTSMRHLAKVANLGTDLNGAVETLELMGPSYHYFLAAYPEFAYHFVEECERRGIDLKKFSIDVVTGGGGFVEEWRDDLIKRLGRASIIFSVYGSTDKGLGEGVETNFAYALRSLLYIASICATDSMGKGSDIMRRRFGEVPLPFATPKAAEEFFLEFLRKEDLERIPMVFQFNPMNVYTENRAEEGRESGREFISTVLSPITPLPRFRYNIHDEGFMLPYEKIVTTLRRHAIEISTFNSRGDHFFDLHLPFLFVFGRSDGVVSIDGAKIFPEDVARCLYTGEKIFASVNSFQLAISKDYRLQISLELKEGIALDKRNSKKYREYFLTELPKFSLGYQEISNERLPSAELVLETHPFGTGPFSIKSIKSHYLDYRSVSAA